jgi:hypothetical protein
MTDYTLTKHDHFTTLVTLPGDKTPRHIGYIRRKGRKYEVILFPKPITTAQWQAKGITWGSRDMHRHSRPNHAIWALKHLYEAREKATSEAS